MDNFEKVEKIREKTGVSYTVAKEALEACNYDLLDAIVYLENRGFISGPQVPVYEANTTNDTKGREDFERTQRQYEQDNRESFGNRTKSFFGRVGKFIGKSFHTNFIVIRGGQEIVKAPVIALIILMIAMFWIIFPLLVVGLFLDCRYRFEGFGDADENINRFCDTMSDGADNIKKDNR